MAQAKTNQKKKQNNGANVGYEAELWRMADALRGGMDAAELQVCCHDRLLDRRLWQLNYYEHIIRDGDSLNRIRQHISRLRAGDSTGKIRATAREPENAGRSEAFAGDRPVESP